MNTHVSREALTAGARAEQLQELQGEIYQAQNLTEAASRLAESLCRDDRATNVLEALLKDVGAHLERATDLRAELQN